MVAVWLRADRTFPGGENTMMITHSMAKMSDDSTETIEVRCQDDTMID